ncbi:MAG: hypothetical protein BMS9Abin05_0004 [Rhodothermia bacterium]|nr:MAG: hypothetical protein BMS9Abin05_0004 [Rhodothermia bacterium]
MPQKELTDRTCIRTNVDAAKLQSLRKDAFSNDHIVALSAFMSAAGNETRLRILYVLWRAGELCVCDLSDVCGISQPAVSRHLKILREKALVESRRDAQTLYYHIYSENPFAHMLESLFGQQAESDIYLTFEAAGQLVNLTHSEK